MSSQTTNLGLYKPDMSDTVNSTIPQLSSNFDKIDSSFAERMLSVKSPQFGAIGDGVHDDTTAIQNAYNSLTNGGTLFFPAGKYKVTQTLNFNLSNVNLVGIGSASVIQILSNQQADGTRIHLNNCSNVIIRDLKASEVNPTLGRYNVYGTFGFETVTNLFMENVEVDGANGVGIHGMNCQNVTIINPHIHNTYADGIHFQRGSKDIKIYSPNIHDTQDDCIGLVSHAFATYGQCDGLFVEGGTLQNPSVTGSGVCGDGSINITLRDVKIKNTQLSGVRIQPLTENGSTAYPANIDISSPIIDTTGLTTGSGLKAGINIGNANNVKIKNPTLRNCIGGIHVIGCNGIIDIDNIEAYNTTDRLVWISSQTIGSNNFAIVKVKNILSKINNVDGIYIDGTQLKIDYVAISNNDLIDVNNANAAGIYGIYVSTAANVILEHNKAYSKNSITKIGTTSVDTLTQVNNLPLDASEQMFVGSAKHTWGSGPPTTGSHNLSDIVWNWNPQSSAPIGWVCVATGTPGTWRQIATILTS